MPRISLRKLLLAASILFSVIVIGGVLLTAYLILADGLQTVAFDVTERLAATASALVAEASSSTVATLNARGFRGSQLAATAQSDLDRQLSLLLGPSTIGGAEFALYNQDLEPTWSSSPAALNPDQQAERARTRDTGTTTRTIGRPGGLLDGLVFKARLATAVVHEPITLPGGQRGVLDVSYYPSTEEHAIDSVRVPMFTLAFAAMVIMVALMQTSMVWVLNLVDNLRKAADSIDAGRFDERLPDVGDNEVGALARSVNRLIERLQRRSEAQAHFVADASHELATPVAGIRGYTSILREWGAEDPIVREEAVEAIDRESQRMARLTGDLLNILHADQALTLKSEVFDLNTVVRQRLALIASRWIEKDLEFVGPEDESLSMVGDAGRVEDVISILLDNAAKYTPAEGSVFALTERSGDTVTVQVSDTGQGIPEADLPRIFDRFFRTEASRAAGESGFGLGLAIAKSIVDTMGGEIEVSSIIGQGTTFTVTLPRGRV
jgi:two-component system, OmpR family, sensor kinase